MTSQEQGFQGFADFAARLKGDEKSEAQTFLFHLLEAFNHDANTLPENSTFEYRVRFPGQKIKFADFVWPARVLIEMKSRGEKLSQHYQQTFDYWLNLVPYRPPFVVLCNFDEFWIYDFNTQLQEPMDRIPVTVFDTFARPQFGLGGTGYQPVPSGNLPDGIGEPGKTRTLEIRRCAPPRCAASCRAQTGQDARSTPAGTAALEKIRAVAEAARALRHLRHEIMDANNWSLRELYKSLETPGENRLRTAHAALDAAVRAAYGMKPDEDILAFLLKLNLELAEKEKQGEPSPRPACRNFIPIRKN